MLLITHKKGGVMTFKEYIYTLFEEDYPYISNDPDVYNTWLYDQDPELLIEYADKWHKKEVSKCTTYLKK
jgi:hypothetical protein